jgi:hypothetical protein
MSLHHGPDKFFFLLSVDASEPVALTPVMALSSVPFFLDQNQINFVLKTSLATDGDLR